MTWTKLLVDKDAQKHKTSKKELDNIRALIARDLADAGFAGLSADRRFATAYNAANAALQAANVERKGLNCLPMLHGWDNFFIMAGTAAATLVGLLFVAVTVGTGLSTSSIVHGSRGFLTPTLVHLGSVLFQTLAVLAPWPSAWPIGIILGLGGLMGLTYQINVVVARHKVGMVLPHWRDWLPYVGVPALGSATLIVGAVGLIAEKSFAPYAIAGAMVLLLLAGIYGAWDLTLWMIKNRNNT